MNHHVYSKITNEVEKNDAGWFEPRSWTKIDRNFHHTHFMGYIDWQVHETQSVMYYPGAFSIFHRGHIDAIIRALNSTNAPRKLLIIAPSNTDYLHSKIKVARGQEYDYGNKARFDGIVNLLQQELEPEMLKHIAIDLSPMLNYTCDQNFTDLALDWMESNNLSMVNTRLSIVCAKDRNWSTLSKYTSINVIYIEPWNTIEMMISSAKLANEAPKRNKKVLKLRCWNVEQYDLFRAFFEHQYLHVQPLFIQDEIDYLKNRIGKRYDYTICKDYASLYEYVPFTRNFAHALADANPREVSLLDKRLKTRGLKIIDSDSYSGSTRRALKDMGHECDVIMNLESLTNHYELLDIDDFYNPGFCYPHVDIAARCSMEPFTHECYKTFNKFIEQLQLIKRD